MRIFLSSILILIAASCQDLPESAAKLVPIELNLAKGWAKTSVNATVFRKNSVVSDGHFQYAAWYDSSGYVNIGKRALDSDQWEIRQTTKTGNVMDAHNIISIMIDGEGYLHMAWDHHGHPLNYCKSKTPGGLEFTDSLAMVGELESAGVTYPEFYKLPDGDLLFAYRYGASGGGNLVLNRYDVDTQKWNRVHTSLIDGEGERNAYWQMCVDENGSLHLSWVWRETWDVFTNHDMCYARSDDGGETWHTSTGKNLKIPITSSTAEYALKIPQGSSLINQTSITADDKGNPFIVSYWTPEGEDVPQFFLIYKKDGKWTKSRVSDRRLAFSLKGGGSRRIPVSRPQVLFSDNDQSIHVIYRDKEKQNRICVASASMSESLTWQLKTVPDIEVGQWEPSYDTEMWRHSERLNLFVQNVGQGAGNENPEEKDPQMVKILAFDELGK